VEADTLPQFNVRINLGANLVADLTSGKVTIGQGNVKTSSTKDVSNLSAV
jgi:hypothetical protein